jgi:PKD repeat protein
MGGQISPSQNSLKHRSFDGATAGGVVADGAGGLDWTLVRGAFMINGQLYYGLSTDGSFNHRTYNGVSLGSPTPINAADQLVPMSTWHNQVKVLQGMFYANGRLYYTRGDAALHYRYFNPESDIVGPDEFTAAGNLPGVSWSSVGGMFVDGDQLYFVNNSTGSLNRIAFTGGVPAGSASIVNSGDWRARGVFLFQGPPNQPPVASFSSSCQELACGFNGTASSDPDGTVTSYAWDFGDGATATGAQPAHTFATAGTYPVKLTVTDNLGGTGSVTHNVQVARSGIDFRATAGFNANTNAPTVTVPAGVQSGDAMLLMLTINSSTVTISSNPAGWETVGTATSSGITSRVWKRIASGDAGTTVAVGLSDFAKADLRVVAYGGTNGTDPVVAATSSIDAAATATHTSPLANVAQTGSWAVSYWADKGTTTAWTAPGAVVTRASSFGSSTAHISALSVDSGGAVGAGTYGGLSAIADVAANKAVSWTIVLAP